MKQKRLIAIISVSCMMMFFQNCDQAAVQFDNIDATIQSSDIGDDFNPGSDDENQDGNGGEDLVEVDPDDPNQDDVENNLNIVYDACDTYEPQTLEATIDFPEFAGCSYNMDGNLEKRNGYYQARVEHNRMLELPEGAILCDLDMSTEVTTMRYDDHFLLTLNDYIIGASTNEFMQSGYVQPAAEMEGYGNIYRYDWAGIAGNIWDSQGAYPTYCLGEDNGVSNCTIPVTDTTGSFALDIGAPPVRNIMALSAGSNQHEFSFVVTGDNDLDCRSSAFSFNVNVSYVVAP